MKLWIATREGDSAGAITEAVIVYAERVEDAADEAARLFHANVDYAQGDELRNVFVASWEPAEGRCAFRTEIGAVLADEEFQCCGGAHGSDYEHMAGGHWATCDRRPEGTGQSRDDSDPATDSVAPDSISAARSAQ